jgi:hypothetical protein
LNIVFLVNGIVGFGGSNFFLNFEGVDPTQHNTNMVLQQGIGGVHTNHHAKVISRHPPMSFVDVNATHCVAHLWF